MLVYRKGAWRVGSNLAVKQVGRVAYSVDEILSASLFTKRWNHNSYCTPQVNVDIFLNTGVYALRLRQLDPIHVHRLCLY